MRPPAARSLPVCPRRRLARQCAMQTPPCTLMMSRCRARPASPTCSPACPSGDGGSGRTADDPRICSGPGARRCRSIAGRFTPELLHARPSQSSSRCRRRATPSVAEFHHLHHVPAAVRAALATAMSEAFIAAAATAGSVRLIPAAVLYMAGGFDGGPVGARQRRPGHAVEPSQVAGRPACPRAKARCCGPSEAFKKPRKLLDSDVYCVAVLLTSGHSPLCNIASRPSEVDCCGSWCRRLV